MCLMYYEYDLSYVKTKCFPVNFMMIFMMTFSYSEFNVVLIRCLFSQINKRKYFRLLMYVCPNFLYKNIWGQKNSGETNTSPFIFSLESFWRFDFDYFLLYASTVLLHPRKKGICISV